ncbi:MAG TPA: TIGR03435 family protein [Candidatus Solibacter sp.]|nr:TIGR03435 family protein [Candidatus Solibacter sp.]
MRTATLALFAIAAYAQGPAPKLEFEVASIKQSGPITPQNASSIGVHIDGALVSFRFLSLQDYIIAAYNIKKHQLAGPDWLSTERFDIQAKIPAGLPQENMIEKRREMLRSLLEDRFKMKFHRETREMPVYALVVNKGGHKMTEQQVDPDATAPDRPVDVTVKAGNNGTTVSLPGGASIVYGFLTLEAKKVKMDGLADNLARFVDRPVIEDTGLKGAYDFKLEFNVDELKSLMRTSGSDPNMLQGVPEHMGTSILTSLQSLGLKLESRKAPMEVLVVDKMEKLPTDN